MTYSYHHLLLSVFTFFDNRLGRKYFLIRIFLLTRQMKWLITCLLAICFFSPSELPTHILCPILTGYLLFLYWFIRSFYRLWLLFLCHVCCNFFKKLSLVISVTSLLAYFAIQRIYIFYIIESLIWKCVVPDFAPGLERPLCLIKIQEIS